MIEIVHGIRIQNPEEIISHLHAASRNEADANRFTASLNMYVTSAGLAGDVFLSRRVRGEITRSAYKVREWLPFHPPMWCEGHPREHLAVSI